MDFIKPEILSIHGYVSEYVLKFKEGIENYFIATESYKNVNFVRVARLKNFMGKETLKLYNSLAKDIES